MSVPSTREVPMRLKLQLGLVIIRLALAIPFAVVRGVLSKTNAKRSWKRAAQLSMTRELLKHISRVDVRAVQLIGESTGSVYRSWANANQLPITSDEIGEGGYVHWIGEKQLNKVILHFHGGGYVFGASTDCFDAVLALKEDIGGTTIDGVGAALLEYSLTPGAPFPTQLRQATAALNYLLSQGVSPSNIVLGGDSAGANLILQLVSHILHPLSDLPTPPQLLTPLAGIVLISPWTSYNDHYRSFKANALEDVLPPEAYMYFAGIASAGITEKMRGHFEPATVPSQWWTGLREVTPRVLVTMGEKECLFDQVVDLSLSLGPYTQVEKVVQVNGVHEDFIFAFGAGAQEGREGDDFKAVVAWLRPILG
ncbi:alpha/beta-hydrolase [Peniophora sp. CONT]|nr:alpha/beta-hydrolase [Peniophora sp. CONT]